MGLDEVIVFHPLTRENIHQIVSIQFNRLVRAALLRQGLDAQLTDAAKDYLSAQGYDPVFGARPLKRIMQRQIMNEFAKMILAGQLEKGDKMKIDAKGQKLTFEKI